MWRCNTEERDTCIATRRDTTLVRFGLEKVDPKQEGRSTQLKIIKKRMYKQLFAVAHGVKTTHCKRVVCIDILFTKVYMDTLPAVDT